MSVKTLVYPVQAIQVNPPVGGATAANQVLEIAELQDINTELDAQTVLLTSMDSILTNIDTNTANLETELQSVNTELDAQTVLLTSLDGKDFATETTLASIETSVQAIESSVAATVVDFIDTTPLLDTSATNIPASASNPLEIVSSLAAAVTKVQTVEDIGEYIGLYTGAALAETLVAILPLGGGEVEVQIPASTRVSLRAMENVAISSGKIAINFIG